jgi:hypothetical protein
MATVEIHHSVPREPHLNEWTLCFQEVTYHFDETKDERGFRLIWQRPDGSLQAARGQARIPDARALFDLLRAAQREGWFTLE